MFSFKEFLKGLTRKEIAAAYRGAKAMKVVDISIDKLEPLEKILMLYLKDIVDYYGQQEGDCSIGTDFVALYEKS